ncbi:hypothetical protein GOBAR_DD03108 [Gossypium barbadense]|nr:hypothetical protein GOBAR_DD03108 [Gossypium barbadense]
MEQKSLIILIILTCLIAPSCGRELLVTHKDKQAVYNRTLATILVEYASAVYMSDLTELFTWTCARCGVIELVVDIQNCLQVHFVWMKCYCMFLIVWLYNLGLGSVVYQFEKVCDGSGEDPDCSRSVTGSSITDHLNYYGVDLTFIRWRSCRIVMDPRVEEYGKTDDKGNIVLSRDPATLVPRMNTLSNGREATYNA